MNRSFLRGKKGVFSLRVGELSGSIMRHCPTISGVTSQVISVARCREISSFDFRGKHVVGLTMKSFLFATFLLLFVQASVADPVAKNVGKVPLLFTEQIFPVDESGAI